MNIPPTPGMAETPEMWDKAQEQATHLLEELKKAVKVDAKDIGVLRKELSIHVPAKVIADHMEENYRELMHDAFVPGFRKGRAPRRLVEKRFGAEVRESLTTAVVGQSYYAVVENEKLETLGDPLFRIEGEDGAKLVDFDQALEHLKLPEQGDFDYVCEVELKPTFDLPELTGIEIKAPDIGITDEMIDEQILRRRKLRGRVEPVTGGALKDDLVIADVVLTAGGQEVKREENVTIGVRPTSVEGVLLPNLGEVLAGVGVGQSRTVEMTLPDDYERVDLRGKAGKVEIKVHEIKRLVPEDMAAFMEAWGYTSEKELRESVKSELESERDEMMARAKKAQVQDYLVGRTTLELPQDFSTRQTERAVLRRMVDLQKQGVPVPDIEARIDELRTHAREQVARELKLAFILEKVAEKLGIEVTDEEVNTEIARIARLYGRRFDRVRDDLASRGMLDQLVEGIRNDKCIARLLEDAKAAA